MSQPAQCRLEKIMTTMENPISVGGVLLADEMGL
jgi:hypothetical protein